MDTNQDYIADRRIPLPHEVMNTETSKPQSQTEEELEKEFIAQFELDPEVEDEPIVFGFRIGDSECIPLGDVAGVKGLAKSAKTQFDVILMAAALRGEYMGIKCLLNNPKILFCDSEQHPRNVRLVYRRVCLLAGIDGHQRHEQINMQHLRLAADVETMKKAIFLKIKHYRPNLCFIDGVADLVNDFNNVTESKEIITELSRIALEYNCAIICTVHTNASEDSKPRGHLGSFLTQKASDVISCKKDKREDGTTVFHVEETENRNSVDFAQFTFAIELRQDTRGEYLAVPVRKYVSDGEKTMLDELFKWALKDSPLRRSDLKDKIISDGCPLKCKRSQAYQRINDGLAAGIISDDDAVTHRLRYIGLNLPNEDGCPF